MIKDLIISSSFAVLYVLSVIGMTVLTVNVFDTCVDLSTVGIFPYLLFGFFYAFVAYDVYYEPILDTI